MGAVNGRGAETVTIQHCCPVPLLLGGRETGMQIKTPKSWFELIAAESPNELLQGSVAEPNESRLFQIAPTLFSPIRQLGAALYLTLCLLVLVEDNRGLSYPILEICKFNNRATQRTRGRAEDRIMLLCLATNVSPALGSSGFSRSREIGQDRRQVSLDRLQMDSPLL